MPSVVPLIKLKLDKVRHLRLDLNAMVAYERVSGKKIESFGLDSSMEEVLYLLWACLLHEDKELTVEEVGSTVHAGNLKEIDASLSQAFRVAMPEETDSPKKPRRSSGSRSGPSDATISP